MREFTVRPLATIGLVVTIVAMLACQHPVQAQMKKSLYERLGGYDAVSAVVSDFADRLFRDEKLSSFFGGWSGDSRRDSNN